MDRKHSQKAEIQRLIRLGEAARARLHDDASALKHRLDVPSRVRDSLKAHPGGWMFGSLASGLAASLMFRRRPAAGTRKSRGGILRSLLGLGFTAAGPLVKIWLGDQVKQWLSASPPPATKPGRPVARPLPRSQSL
jgi:hypothetical protein